MIPYGEIEICVTVISEPDWLTSWRSSRINMNINTKWQFLPSDELNCVLEVESVGIFVSSGVTSLVNSSRGIYTYNSTR